jgi:hypothetical protein
VDKPPFEVADIIRSLVDTNGVVPGLRVTWAQQRVLNDLAACRTAKLGGHVEACDACGVVRVAYNSCRNRHCPKCQAKKRAEWLEARCQDLLPVPYFHIVFTLPAEIAAVALQNKREIYNLLFKSACATLKEIAADPKHLGAEIGIIAVLHTWGQTLVHHPHIHCVVPGGGLAPDGSRWIASKEDFFLSVRVLSRLFRGKFLDGLQAAYRSGSLQLSGSLAELTSPARFAELRTELFKKEWVVYSKPPFGGSEQVLKYVARYTHRVAISNWRILSAGAETVTFRYKDYRHGNSQRSMKLTGVEFLRRFLLHVLPDGFMRIRYYGFLANTCRKDKIAKCRELLSEQPSAIDPNEGDATAGKNTTETETDTETERCTACGVGTMRTIDTFDPQQGWTYEPCAPVMLDSS